MTDIERAIENLSGHTICLCKGENIITDDGKGISPMMKFIGENKGISGYSAADIIVGKAAAMLFVKAGISAVHGKVMSYAGKEYLESRGIPCTYDTLTENITDRSGKDICPMERTVSAIEDPDVGYEALKAKIAEMRNKKS